MRCFPPLSFRLRSSVPADFQREREGGIRHLCSSNISNACTKETEFVLVVELPSSEGVAIEEDVMEINRIEWMEGRNEGGLASIALGRD